MHLTDSPTRINRTFQFWTIRLNFGGFRLVRVASKCYEFSILLKHCLIHTTEWARAHTRKRHKLCFTFDWLSELVLMYVCVCERERKTKSERDRPREILITQIRRSLHIFTTADAWTRNAAYHRYYFVLVACMSRIYIWIYSTWTHEHTSERASEWANDTNVELSELAVSATEFMALYVLRTSYTYGLRCVVCIACIDLSVCMMCQCVSQLFCWLSGVCTQTHQTIASIFFISVFNFLMFSFLFSLD